MLIPIVKFICCALSFLWLSVENIRMTCASSMLENYIAPYTATCVQRLINRGFKKSKRLQKNNVILIRRLCGGKGEYG